jgi:hypothetical protein
MSEVVEYPSETPCKLAWLWAFAGQRTEQARQALAGIAATEDGREILGDLAVYGYDVPAGYEIISIDLVLSNLTEMLPQHTNWDKKFDMDELRLWQLRRYCWASRDPRCGRLAVASWEAIKGNAPLAGYARDVI